MAGRLGAIYADSGEYELSNQYIDRAIRLSESEKDFQCLAEQYFMRALNYQQAGQVSEGLNFCLRSIEIFSKIGLTAQIEQAQVLLSELQST